MATRIALYEAGGSARFIEVDTKATRLVDGGDFLAINPLGYVPVIRTYEGESAHRELGNPATRGGAVSGRRARPGERSRLQAWLCFIGTELHKGLFTPLLDRKAPEAASTRSANTAHGSTISTRISRDANSCSTASASPTRI